MKVLHFMSYLSRIPEDAKHKNEAFWANLKIKKWLKGEVISGSFELNVNGHSRKFFEKDRDECLDLIWGNIAAKMNEVTAGKFEIVPMPGHEVIKPNDKSYRNFRHAEDIAKFTCGRAVANSSLYWEAVQEKQRAATGFRHWTDRFTPMRVGKKPTRDVVLFDDILTSGSTLIAAKKRLEEVGANVVAAFVVSRAVHEPPATIKWGEVELQEGDLFSDFF